MKPKEISELKPKSIESRWASQAFALAARAGDIEAAVAPLRKPLADDIDAYVRMKPGTPWMMVDATNKSSETNDSTQMRTLLSIIMADCEASIAALRSLQFSPSPRYPQTEQGMADWSEARENAIRQTKNFIELLSSGGAHDDLSQVSQSAKYCAESLQTWKVLTDSLRNDMLSLRNTLANYRNADGLKEMYESLCEKAVATVMSAVRDVEKTSGLQPDTDDLSRSDILREAGQFRAGKYPKFLASQIESWLERVKRDAKKAPEASVDSSVEPPAKPAATEAVASTASGLRALIRSLFWRGW